MDERKKLNKAELSTRLRWNIDLLRESFAEWENSTVEEREVLLMVKSRCLGNIDRVFEELTKYSLCVQSTREKR